MGEHRSEEWAHLVGTSRIVCVRHAEAGEQLFTMRPDGSDLQQLTAGTGQSSNWSPVWSPDGSRLCFTSNRTGHVCLWLMAADGSDQRQLTCDTGAEDYEPSWSPDGARIVFSRGDHRADDLWIVEVACGEARALTDEQRLDASPAWSPDGHWIVFCRAFGSPPGLYAIPAEGGPAHFVASGSWSGWAPDGEHLAFVHGGSLWVLTVNGECAPVGRARPLVCAAEIAVGASSWSPDGARVVFEARRNDAGGTSECLMVVDTAGGEPHQVGPGSQPSWSPWLD